MAKMERYRNRSGDAGILAYASGPDWIRLRFSRGDTYEYTSDTVGAANLKSMKRLAHAGKGLTTFINQHPRVKLGYTEHLG
jgi:hypothetical protein